MSEEDVRKPIEQVLAGLQLHPPPTGWAPLEGIILVKILDQEGTRRRFGPHRA
jgi:hypothetical protein